MSNKKKVSLLAVILSILKLDDEGKVWKFFQGEIKRFKREISKIEANIKSATLMHENALSDIDEAVEDAEDAISASYQAVQLDRLTSNESMKEFSESYWRNITRAESKLEALGKDREALTERFELKTEYEKSQIQKYKARIAKLN